MVWVMKEAEAEEYRKQEMIKFVCNYFIIYIQAQIKSKLNLRGRKPAMSHNEFKNVIGSYNIKPFQIQEGVSGNVDKNHNSKILKVMKFRQLV